MCFGAKQPDPPKPEPTTMTFETETNGVTTPVSSTAPKNPKPGNVKESTAEYRGGRNGPSGLGNVRM